MNRRNEKEPPEGMDFDGTPGCTMGYRMTYWGVHNAWLKFRCSHATGQVDCPLGMAACSSNLRLGRWGTMVAITLVVV